MKTTNMTQYTCDRCGRTEYLSDTDARNAERRTWWPVTRMTGDDTSAQVELCNTCHDSYLKLLQQQTADFDAWRRNATPGKAVA